MQILLRAEIGREQWNRFVNEHPHAWWWHSWEWCGYQAARGGREVSFAVFDGRRILAICPLFVEEKDGIQSFTVEGHPGSLPLFCPSPDGILERIEELARLYRVRQVAFRTHPFSLAMPANVEIIDGWEMSRWQTQVLGLDQPVSVLHAGLRKSYTALINKASRDYEIVCDREGKLIHDFRLLHRQDAGRETRPKATWDMQAEWCKTGNGLVVAAYSGARMVGATYWILYKKAGYYSSSCSAVENVTHALVWRAMLELKAMGVEKLELGWCERPGDNEKEKKIAFFKRGFGGERVPIVAVERIFK